MPDIDIVILRHGDPPAWPELNDNPAVLAAAQSWRLAVLEGGMVSGRPSLALRLEVDVPRLVGGGSHRKTIVAEMSLAAWIAATCAMRGAFPEAFAGGPLAAVPE